MKRFNRRGVRAIVCAGALMSSTILTTAIPSAGAADAPTPAPPCAGNPTLPGAPGITINNPNCEGTRGGLFSSLDGSSVWAGTIEDSPAGGVTLPGGNGGGGISGYRVEVPAHWNGTLVMFAHGFAGTGTTVAVSDPNLRKWFVDNGYAWAASSYAMNGYDVGTGVVDTHDLLEAFATITGLKSPTQVIMSGLSMGGAITAVEIEHYPNTFAGAMPYCGVLGGNDLFNFFLGANVTAAAVTGTSIPFPADPLTYPDLVVGEVNALGIGSPSLTPEGQAWETAVESLSGGTRPGFDGSLTFWDSFGFAPLTTIPFLFGLYPGLTGGGEGFLNGNVTDNENTFYRFSNTPGHSDPVSRGLNAQVLRVARTVPFSTDPTATELPDVTGTPSIPVVSVHGIGDLFVPFSMEQDYARLADANGQGDLFVSRAIREVNHCDYNNTELASAFSALTNWINTGQRAAGDQILNPRAVASPDFGCRFTVGTHAFFQGSACPTSSPGPGRGHGNGAG
jgi:hypothetical protein